MKLDESDYENIFLRVRGRLALQLVLVFSTILAAIGVTTYYSAKKTIERKTESAVIKYVQSEEFKKDVISSYQEKLTRLDNQTAEIAKLLSEQQRIASHLSEIPIVIDKNGLTLINKSGHKFRIEMGDAEDGSKVLFSAPYQTEPAVLLSIDSSKLDGISLHHIQRMGAVLAVNSSTRGFDIPASSSMIRVGYHWVAFGQ